MSILVSCDSCSKQLKVRDEAAGKRVKCPECGGVIEIPVPDDVVDAEAADENPFEGGKISSEGDVSSDGGKYDRKPCPACGEMIVKAAAKCRFCGEIFDPDLKQQSKSNRRRSSRDDFDDDDDVVRYPTADLGKRLLAVLTDGLATVVFIAPGIGLLLAGGGPDGLDQGSPLAIAGLLLCLLGGLALVIVHLYLLIKRSQSIGKYFMNIQIFDYETDTPASFTKTFLLRGLVNGLIGGIPCVGPIYSLVDILFIFGDEHRCLHDLLAGTYVVDIS
ncbi:MAG: RDD family protein [Candidatus Saccharimonas sp.]|nr:RDD family protein [Planctomycetaceae bacterium]